MCTVHRAKLVVISLLALACVGYSCSIWTSTVTVLKGKYRVCAPIKQYEKLHTVLTYIDTCVTLFIPYILLIIINFIIARRITVFYNRHKGSMTFEYGKESRCRVHGRSCNLGMTAQIKMTKMLFFISAVFFILNLPSYAMRLKVILMSFFNEDYEGTTQEFLLQQVFQFLYYINFSINFLLYSGCSDKFREALRRFWWKVRYKLSRCCFYNVYESLFGKFSSFSASVRSGDSCKHSRRAFPVPMTPEPNGPQRATIQLSAVVHKVP